MASAVARGDPHDIQKRASAGLIVPQFAHGAVTSWECRDEISDRTAPRRRPYPSQDPWKEFR